MHRILAAAGLTALFALAGCASIVSGSSQNVTFDSSPQGAKVTVNGNAIGTTPISLKLARDSDTVVTVSKEGYKTQIFPLKHRFNPYFWGNVITGGVFGSTTDGITGATVEYTPDHYYTTLQPVDAQASNGIEDKRTQVSQFVVSNYGALNQELNSPNKKGEHVATLLDMLGIGAGDQDATVAVLKDLDHTTRSAPDFSNAIVQKFAL